MSNENQEGKFSKTLFQELKATSLHMPSLANLSDREFYDLAQGITDQITHVTEKKLFLEVAELSYKNSFEKTIYCSDLAFHHHPAHDEKEILQLLD